MREQTILERARMNFRKYRGVLFAALEATSKKHLTLVSETPFGNSGVLLTWRCATTGKTYTERDSGNRFNTCTSFTCKSCGECFDGFEMDQPWVKNPPKRQETRAGITATDAAFRLSCINNAEMGDSSPEFWSKIVMPDGKTAWDWLEEWPKLRSNVYISEARSGEGDLKAT